MNSFPDQIVTVIATLAIALPLLIVALFAGKIVLYSRRVKRGVEHQTMIGMTGRAESEISGTGLVFVRGELWHACADGRIAAGERVRVVGFSRLALIVEAAESV